MQKKWLLLGLTGLLAVAVACGGDSPAPVSPSPAGVIDATAAADGSTLKVSAPTLSTPANNATNLDLQPLLTASTSTGKFVTATNLLYRFQVVNAAGQDVFAPSLVNASGTTASVRVATALTYKTTYRWRVRAEQGSLIGPWSAYSTFTTMEEPPPPPDPFAIPGYFRANEIWDPLTKGVSVGTANGMEFSADGARTVSNESNITYPLLQTLTAGEFSFYVYNLNPLSLGDKTKLMSMQEGSGDITANDYRFTVEKRGVQYIIPGQVRIRVINGDSGDHGNIHDSVPTVPSLIKAQWYFVRLTWGSNTCLFRIYLNDPNGALIASIPVNYPGRQYQPTPHFAYVGGPVGRNGPIDGSVHNMTVKGVFIGGVGAVRPTASGGGVVGGIDF